MNQPSLSPAAGGTPWPVKHFVITRFNLRGVDPSSLRMISREYLDQRLALFERFCLPTLRSQTRQDFTWLVLFSDDTPADVKARVSRYAEWPNLVPVWLPPGTGHVGRVVVRPYLDDAPQTLITTRIDNDDGLSRTFIEDVRRFEGVRERSVVQFPVGYVWHHDRIYLDRQEHNAFTTLIEPLPEGRNSEYFTIYKGSHTEIQDLGAVIDGHQRPAWLQVVHDTNVANHLRGRRERIASLSEHFDVSLPPSAAGESSLEIGVDRVRTFAVSTVMRVVLSAKWRLERARGD